MSLHFCHDGTPLTEQPHITSPLRSRPGTAAPSPARTRPQTATLSSLLSPGATAQRRQQLPPLAVESPGVTPNGQLANMHMHSPPPPLAYPYSASAASASAASSHSPSTVAASASSSASNGTAAASDAPSGRQYSRLLSPLRGNNASSSSSSSALTASQPLNRHASCPGPSSPSTLTVNDALAQSLLLLQRLTEQLAATPSAAAATAAKPSSPMPPTALSRDLGQLSALLTAAAARSSTEQQLAANSQRRPRPSALDFQRSLQQNLRRRARETSVKEDLQVIDWISSQYNAPAEGRVEDEDDDEEQPEGSVHTRLISPAAIAAATAAAARPKVTGLNFHSTLLCWRFLRKVREAIHRRALAESAWGSMVALHLTDPLHAVLEGVDRWDFDLFALEALAGPQLLQILSYHIFVHRLGSLERFSIRPEHFANFFQAIEEGYNDVPYHSHTHAADVLQNTYYFLTQPSQKSKVTDLDIFAGCIAAAIHDYKHPGTNNVFQIMTGADAALRYNDRSVLENMHVSESFLLLKKPHHNIMAGLTPADRTEARATIIAMVMATDMSAHFKNLAELKSQLDAHKSANKEWNNTNSNDRRMCMETALHCADLGNPTKNLPIYLEWTRRVMDEFYSQGDLERQLGLPISAMCDRTKPSVERSQIGFIDFIVKPLFEAYCLLNGELQSTCMVHAAHNRSYFSGLLDGMPQTPKLVPATPASHAPPTTATAAAAAATAATTAPAAHATAATAPAAANTK